MFRDDSFGELSKQSHLFFFCVLHGISLKIAPIRGVRFSPQSPSVTCTNQALLSSAEGYMKKNVKNAAKVPVWLVQRCKVSSVAVSCSVLRPSGIFGTWRSFQVVPAPPVVLLRHRLEVCWGGFVRSMLSQPLMFVRYSVVSVSVYLPLYFYVVQLLYALASTFINLCTTVQSRRYVTYSQVQYTPTSRPQLFSEEANQRIYVFTSIPPFWWHTWLYCLEKVWPPKQIPKHRFFTMFAL